MGSEQSQAKGFPRAAPTRPILEEVTPHPPTDSTRPPDLPDMEKRLPGTHGLQRHRPAPRAFTDPGPGDWMCTVPVISKNFSKLCKIMKSLT